MTSPVDTSVKFFRNDFPGAPAVSGTVGAFIGALDACLLTGFGVRPVTSLVVSGGVATLTVASEAKNLNMVQSVVLVEGVTGGMTALNGEQKITGATATTLTFATAVADGTASGAITVKTAPAGQWEKAFSATNVACYRSLDPMSFGAYLQVTDTGTTKAGVRMFEAMSDAATGTNQAPTTLSAATAEWLKSAGANSNPVKWDLFADSRRLIWCVAPDSHNPATNSVGQTGLFFGDILKAKSIDPYAGLLTTNAQGSGSYGSVFIGSQGGVSQAPSRILRGYTGLGAATQAWAFPAVGTASQPSGQDSFLGGFPTIDGKLRLSRILVTEGTVAYGSTGTVVRGAVPGCFYAPHSGGGASFLRGLAAGVEVGGRKLYCIRTGAASSTAVTEADAGYGFVDITGPWGDTA